MHSVRFLLVLVASTFVPALSGASELAALIRSGERPAALAAIRAGADVNALQEDGSSPLLWAVYRVDHDLVAALLERGADPDIANVFGATPLCEAIALGDMVMIEALLAAGADPNLGNHDNQTPLMIAARNGSLPIAQRLVMAGARVNESERMRDQTALMWAISANNPGLVDFLIANGAEVELRAAANDWGNQITSEPRAQYRDTGGLTPLLFATRFGCLPCVKSLLAAGVDVNRPTPEGVTPLMNAIDNNQFAIANYLLDEGADPHRFDWWGRAALYLAADMRTRGGGPGGGPGARAGPAGIRAADTSGAPPAGAPPPGAPPPSALQLLQRLLEMGVDPNTQLNMHRPFRGRFTDDLITTGCTPLLRSALSGDREAVALLLAHGALPDLPNVMGVTPLMAAAGIGFLVGMTGGGQGPIAGLRNDEANQTNAIAVIDLLLKAGADVNARITDTTSRTALIARTSSMTDREGQTALFGAVGNSNSAERVEVGGRSWPRVVQFLIDNGARLDIVDKHGKTILDALQAQAGGRDNPSSEAVVKVIQDAMGN